MKIPNNIVNQLMKLNLNSKSWQLLWFILSKENLESISIDIKIIVKHTGICYNSVIRALKVLVDRNIIIKDSYSKLCDINIDTNTWILKGENEETTNQDNVCVPEEKSNPLFDMGGFRKFVSLYPKHRIRLKETVDAWKKLNPSSGLTQYIIAQLIHLKTSEEWKKDNGKWIPSIYNFIANERWKDELTYQEDWRET